MLKTKDEALVAGVAAYMLLVLAPALLKLAGWRYFVHMSWTKATVLVWGPWLLGAACWLLLGLVSAGEWLLARRQRKLPASPDLASSRQQGAR
jgi:hypothetical protein